MLGVSFKVRPFMLEGRKAIKFKKNVSKADCGPEANQHELFNTCLFEGLLQKAYVNALNGLAFARLDELPAFCSVDNPSTYFVTISVKLPCLLDTRSC